MNLRGVSVNLVRNKYEYDKYVDEEYRKENEYEIQETGFPWIILRVSRTDEFYSEEQNKVTVSFSKDADFTNLGTDYDTNGYAVVTGDKTKFNFDLGKFSSVMLEAKKECGLDDVPANLTVTVEDIDGHKVSGSLDNINLSDKETILSRIDKEAIQQGQGYLAKLLYEIVSEKL